MIIIDNKEKEKEKDDDKDEDKDDSKDDIKESGAGGDTDGKKNVVDDARTLEKKNIIKFEFFHTIARCCVLICLNELFQDEVIDSINLGSKLLSITQCIIRINIYHFPKQNLSNLNW